MKKTNIIQGALMKKTNLVLRVILMMLFVCSTGLIAANQIVTNNNDSGAGSLRQAIVDATDGDEITFNLATGSEIITTSSELLISKSLTIDGSNNEGSGVDVTVQVTTPGTSTYRVLRIYATDKTINISNMTIKGGDISTGGWGNIANWGGSIINVDGTLNLDNITITGSKADWGGGVYTEDDTTIPTTTFNNCNISSCTAVNWGGGVYGYNSTFNINNSTISSNEANDGGGGISIEDGTCSINNCHIYDNTTGDDGSGGGVSNQGYATGATMNITNSLIEGNTANSMGGGIYHNGRNGVTTMTITNTTISGNTSYSNDGGVGITESISTGTTLTTITNSTISGNTLTDEYGECAGIGLRGGTLTIKNTIVEDNMTNGNPEDYFYLTSSTIGVVPPVLVDTGYNVVGYQSFRFDANDRDWIEAGAFDSETSILYNYDYLGNEEGGTGLGWNRNDGSISGSLNLSSTLADNGGPTQTLAIASGSFAISAGSWDASITTDQRGFSRSDPPTIGAFEFEGSDPALPVTLSTFYGTYNELAELYWVTQSETDNLGFNLFRSENENGFEEEEYIQINADLVSGMGTTFLPTNYSFTDEYLVLEGHEYYYWLQSVSTSNELELFGPVSLEIPVTGQLPTMTILETNYPNPFNPETTISFNIKENETGTLEIYNLRGQSIRKEKFEAGNYQYHWNAEGFASGIYFYKLSSPTTNLTKKMILMK
jgi:Secretion system C-terminal sorting domain